MVVALIVGSTGAGKTTYARKLALEISAAVFSIDDWMKSLYWQDMPENPSNSWFLENGQWYVDRIQRCEELILKNVIERARLQENSILDLGFSTSEHRKKFISKLQKSKIPVVTHYLDVSPDLRWERVCERNHSRGETFVMNVDRDMFDYIESIFERPDPSEGAEVIIIKE